MFHEIDDLRVKLNNAELSVGEHTLYAYFGFRLPAVEDAFEIRNL